MFSFLKNGTHIFKRKQEDILSAAFIISLSFVFAKILGFIKLRLLAAYFGSNLVLLDSYFAATAFPDAIFEVLIYGTIALAFIPVFSKYHSHKKLKKAWQLASALITLGFLIFVVFALIFFFLANKLAPILAPGLVKQYPETRAIIGHLLQIIIFSQMFFVISIFITGILQSFQRFLVPALASIFYNLGIIISIIFLVPVFGIYAAAIGMVLGALLHLVIQLPLAQSFGFKFRPNFNFKNKEVLEMLSLMWPRSITIGLTRLSEIINTALASLTVVGSIAALNFAQVLQIVPISFFGTSIAQAAFAFLSIEYNKGRKNQFKKLFTQSLHQILFLVLPIAAILAVLRVPTVRLFFGAPDLPWETTVLTSRTLLAFSVGIAAQAANLLLIRGFHATRDSVTPLKVSSVTTVVNVILSLVLILILHKSIIWLALSFSLTNSLAALLMLYLLDKKLGGFAQKELLIPIFKMGFISFLTAIALYIPMKLLDQLVFDTTRNIGLILLTSTATAVGLIVYISLSWIFKVEQLVIFVGFARRVLSWPAKLKTAPPTPIEAQSQTP